MTAHTRTWNQKGPSIDWSSKTKIRAGQTPQVAREIFRQVMGEKYQGFEHWYTAGSLADGKLGYGVIGPNLMVEA